MENRKYWSGTKIDKLEPNEVFVFGSNPEGIHGAGGAKAAVAFGAKFGNGRGLMGKSYGLVTKNLHAGFTEKSTGITYHKDGYCSVSQDQIRENIDELYECAKQNPNKKFLITFQYETWPNGTPKKSLNGYTSEEMFQMFVRSEIPSNIVFHDSYKDRLEAILNSNKNNDNATKDYILFLNYPTQDIINDSNFWTDYVNDLSNVKEHTMGAGIAKHIKSNFPEAYEADKKTGYGDRNKLGTFSEATVNINGHELTIINAYSQYRYGAGQDHFDYDSFPALLQSIKQKYGNKRIGLPLIGCGLAGGDEPRILKMIRENFEGVDYKLVEIDLNRKLNLGNIESENKSNSDEYTFFFHLTSPFSNFHPARFEYKGYTFISTEQFMMFSKAKTFGDEQTAQRIINIFNEFQKEPGVFKNWEEKVCFQLITAFKDCKITKEQILSDKESIDAWNNIHKKIKQLGREVKNYDDSIWSEKRSKVVGVGLREKFNQNPDLKETLMNTGDSILVEASPYDKIWGIGLSATDAKKTPADKWPGMNLLGGLLTDLKQYYKNTDENSLKKKPKP